MSKWLLSQKIPKIMKFKIKGANESQKMFYPYYLRIFLFRLKNITSFFKKETNWTINTDFMDL